MTFRMVAPLSIPTHPWTPSLRQPLSRYSSANPLGFGTALRAGEFRDIQRRLSLDCCKWDSQVGDVSTLFRQSLLIAADEWARLRGLAEALASELDGAEQELFLRPELHKMLGMPAPLRAVLKDARRRGATPWPVRTMRFDFHYTHDGWQISEVNSDVPGGYIEASAFTEMIAERVPHAKPVGNPARVWIENVARAVGQSGCVALLSAIGFLEDQQVTAFLAKQLQQRGIRAVLLHHPTQLSWKAGRASAIVHGKRVEIGAVVRFYQGEWLARLPTNSGWQWLFARGKTPVTNPATAMLSESKRFPLTWEFLSNQMNTWRTLLPECRDPKHERRDSSGEWVLKMAYSNTGDEVHLRELMSPDSWLKLCRVVRRHPQHWILQRRFHPRSIDSHAGPVYPCIGVYVIDGSVSGAYARVSTKPLIDFAAMDAALLVEEKQC